MLKEKYTETHIFRNPNLITETAIWEGEEEFLRLYSGERAFEKPKNPDFAAAP